MGKYKKQHQQWRNLIVCGWKNKTRKRNSFPPFVYGWKKERTKNIQLGL